MQQFGKAFFLHDPGAHLLGGVPLAEVVGDRAQAECCVCLIAQVARVGDVASVVKPVDIA